VTCFRLSFLPAQLSYNSCWISSGEAISRNILCYDRTCRNDRTTANGYATQDKCACTNPRIVLNSHRLFPQRYVPRVPGLCDLPKLSMPLGSSHWVSEIVEDVDCMSDKHTISDGNGACRPNSSLWPHKAPFANLNLTTMSEHSQFALNDAVAANANFLTIARNVTDASRVAQFSALSKLAGRAEQEALNEIIQIHLINRKSTPSVCATRSASYGLSVMDIRRMVNI
jgi:hypothetical protein